MGILRFDPVRSFEGISRRMGEIANEFEKGFSVEYGGFSPRVDITEDEKALYFWVEIAGVNKEDVKLSINDENILLIKGFKKRDENYENKASIRSERNFGEFTRSFLLPDNINKESILAKFETGVLMIKFDKKEPEKPKEVEISIS